MNEIVYNFLIGLIGGYVESFTLTWIIVGSVCGVAAFWNWIRWREKPW